MVPINIILQGGGTRCAYQVAFLKKILMNPEFQKKYIINQIYGTSFGALVGYFVCINRFDIIEKFFNNLDESSLKPWFNFFGLSKYLYKIPILGNILKYFIYAIWLLISVKKKSLFNQDIPLIQNIFDLNLNLEQQNNLANFRCCVYNITKQKTQYISGNHPCILDYIKASAALWILYPPKKIRQLKTECGCGPACSCGSDIFCSCEIHKYNEYLDGGLLRPIPFPENNNKNLILATENINKIKNQDYNFNNSGDNLFEYLDKIISFLVENIQFNYFSNHKILDNPNNIFIGYNSGNNNPAILDRKTINKYILDGNNLADNFLANL